MLHVNATPGSSVLFTSNACAVAWAVYVTRRLNGFGVVIEDVIDRIGHRHAVGAGWPVRAGRRDGHSPGLAAVDRFHLPGENPDARDRGVARLPRQRSVDEGVPPRVPEGGGQRPVPLMVTLAGCGLIVTEATGG